MFYESGAIEVSTQQLRAVDSAVDAGVAMHAPLPDLAEAAPSVNPLYYRSESVPYPFSNDECTARYFEQLAVRTETPEYENAQNRVAVLVGESGLAANLKHIPEETIVLLDSSPDMCVFMQEYVTSLRESSSPGEWYSRLRAVGPRATIDFMRIQLEKWDQSNVRHPLVDQDAFDEAQKIAKQKTIVTWCADITERDDMAELGRALRERNASITMMNLTNVLPYVETLRDPNECAERLRELPLTPNAPILTTGVRLGARTLIEAISNDRPSNVVTGPFFGLQNLARARLSNARHGLGAIVERNIVSKDPEEAAPAEIALTEQDIIAGIIGSLISRGEPSVLLGGPGFGIDIIEIGPLDFDAPFPLPLNPEPPKREGRWFHRRDRS